LIDGDWAYRDGLIATPSPSFRDYKVNVLKDKQEIVQVKYTTSNKEYGIECKLLEKGLLLVSE